MKVNKSQGKNCEIALFDAEISKKPQMAQIGSDYVPFAAAVAVMTCFTPD